MSLHNLIKYRNCLPWFALHKLHFDHRVFPWGKSKMRIIPIGSEIITMNHMEDILSGKDANSRLMIEAMKYQITPLFKTPFVFDAYDPHCYVLTDEEHYKHLLRMLNKK